MPRSDKSRPPGAGKRAASSVPPHLMRLGKIVRPHGVRGELCMEIYTAYPDRIPFVEKVFLSPERKPDIQTPYTVEAARFHRGIILLTLAGITDRNQADTLRGQLVMVPLSEGAPLADGEIYAYQLVGIPVYTEAGEFLGKVKEILETGANDVYLLDGTERGELLIPDIPDVIISIDMDAQKMVINPISGLLAE